MTKKAQQKTKAQQKSKTNAKEDKLQVLYAIFEATPFIKTGGLGDVGGSLPPAMNRSGVDMRVFLPKLSSIPGEYKKKMKKIAEFYVPLGWRNQYCGVERLKEKNVTWYFIDNEYYFKRPEAYGYFDDGERIAFFSKAVLESIQYIPDFSPSIIHCNDWHTAMIPVFLREHYRGIGEYDKIRTVFSVHNLKFQGIYPNHILGDILGLHECKNAADQLTYGDAINYLQGALYYSDRLTTVSPTYAEEIRSSWYGEHMEDIFKRRESILSGILNGIDPYKNSPGRDPHIAAKYNATTFKAGKAANKEALQKELGLAMDPDTPLLVMISRLTEQKGMDLLMYIMGELLQEDVQVAVLGVGEKKYEDGLRYFNSIMPQKCSACLTFDLPLSSRFYAGADMLLMPSQFEPCGLSQMIAMRYGTIPVVRETGGLRDTVCDFRKFPDEGNGFSFPDYNAHQLLFTIKDAIHIYHKRSAWSKLVKRAMKTDFSWQKSAEKYIQLYKELI